MLQPKKKAYQVIVDQIQEYFLNGELQPGEKLPTERELASRFNVSRTSVREALRKLEIKGIIDIKQGSGSFLKSPECHSLGQELSSTILKTEKKLIYEMLELRQTLEVECAFLASQRATSEDLERIGQALEMMNQVKNDVELGIQADLSFHINIVLAAHNSIFSQLFQTLSEHMQDTIRVTRTQRLKDLDRTQETIDEHKEIYLAIAAGDATQAKQLMEKHIKQIRRELTSSLFNHIGEQHK
ncbi:FadR family transcriptional regulator [Lysinibacillus mangiferihumi]|uniref:FadR family transcriptional regulator n=1 Tax=Lysinibacillus mangiferihumi TaxID=1130819 RepID=A0A4V5TI05_9BACI|nr:FadR/GntR family transcriptional regulator [Lysinibacillus mangiferihumi]TKI53053.1 FadR family transcriptional regulator [Lysinibacillus mangiferihumi]